MKTNRSELIRRLLSGITNDELQNLVEYGKKQDALFLLHEKEFLPLLHEKWGSSN